MPGGLRVTGLHSVAVGEALQNLVGIFQLAGVAVGITKDKLRQANNRADGRIRVGRASDDREVARGRPLIGNRQAIRIHEMRMSRAERTRFRIHFIGESLDAAGVIACQTTGHDVRAFHQQRAEEVDALVDFAWPDV